MVDQARDDGWANLMTGLGVAARDKRKSTIFERDAQHRSQNELEDLYLGDDIAARIVDALPDEMTREWIEVTVGEDPEIVKAMTAKLAELEAQQKFNLAIKYARLFGGSAILLGADDGLPVDQPLSVDTIKRFTFLTVLDRWSIRPDQPYADPLSPKYGKPELYTLQSQIGPSAAGGSTHFGTRVHESRLLRFDGVISTPRQQLRNETWGESVLERVADLLPDFGSMYGSVANLMNDYAQGVFKIKNFQQMMAAGREADIITRLKLMDMSRSIIRSIVVDADGEDFGRETISLAGIADVLDKWTNRIASAAKMPVSILMGQSAGGLNATGEHELRYWYDQVKAQQEQTLRPSIEKLLTLLFKSTDGPTRGAEPEQWSFCFNPLWQLGEVEQADVRLKQAQTDQIYITTGVVSPSEVADSRFSGDGYSTATTLEEQDDETEQVEQVEQVAPGTGDVQATALNGAQVASLVSLVQLVASAGIPRDAAIEIIVRAFTVTPSDADRMLGSAGKGFVPRVVPSGFAAPSSDKPA